MARSGSHQTFAVHSACLRGVEAFPVTVEVSSSGGIPGITIVGMADSAVLEARSRIRCAIRSSGFEVPRLSFTVSLSPGDMRKTGTGFDLAIAVAILALSGQIPISGVDGCLFAGELALDGRVLGVRGEVAFQILSRSERLRFVSGHYDRHISMGNVDQVELGALGGLRGGIAHLPLIPSTRCEVRPEMAMLDYEDVVGQEFAKRALMIAAAGGLGLLMIGPPGSGKTMLARRMTSILPPIDQMELEQALCIHSVMGEPADKLLSGIRPFRNPHHAASSAGLIGGGRPVLPGEISLAHGGVLYLDELGEFQNSVLQMLRQPLEDGEVRLVRVDGTYVFPARFQLLAASNPCPCGYLGDREIACRCSETAVQHYQQRLGGPLIDRIDVVVDVGRPDPSTIVSGSSGASSHDLKEQVLRGRQFAGWRCRENCESGSLRSGLDSSVAAYGLEDNASEALVELARRKRLTARGITRLCRIARTIADVDEKILVTTDNLLEASMLQGRRNERT